MNPGIAEIAEAGNSRYGTHRLSGVWAPCLTPLEKNLGIDSFRLCEHIKWLLENGCNGVVLFGSTGEAASFSASERMAALDDVLESGVAALRVMVGNGFPSITDTVEVTRHTVEHGCKSVLMVPPYYFKNPTVEGLAESYRYVFDRLGSSDLKVILYHFPKQSAVPITYSLLDLLLDSHPELISGVKDSSGDWTSVEGFIQRYPQISIFPGSDMLLLDGLKIGGAGTITATADVNPAGIRKVYDLWREGQNAEESQESAERIREIVFQYPLAPALKSIHAYYRSDLEWRRVRPPLVELSDAETSGLINSLKDEGFKLQ